MPAPALAAHARVRPAWLVPALVGVLAAAVAWWASAPYIVGVFHDDGVYLLLAKAIATGRGFEYLQLPGSPAATHYPPLYPLALAAVWRILPGFPENIPAMLALNAVCIGIAALGLHQLLRRWFGWRDETAALTVLAAFLNVPILTLATALMSEPLFLACLPPVLLAAQGALDRDDRRAALVAGVAIGALMLVRTHALALLGAAVCLLLARRHWRRAALLGAAAVLVQLPWLVWSRLAAPVVADPLQGTYGAYAWFFEEGWRAGGITLLAATVRTNLHELWLLLGDRVWGGLGRVAGIGVALLLVGLLMLGAWRAARRTPLLVLFLVMYFAIVVVLSCAPYRYAWGVWPLLVALAVLGGEELLRRAPGRPWQLAAIVMTGLPLAAIARTEMVGMRSAAWAQPAHNASRAIAPLIEWIRRNTPADATVLVEGGEIATLFTGRRAAPPAPFTAMEYIVPLTAADHRRGLASMLDAVPAQYVVTLHPGIQAAARGLSTLRLVDSLPGAQMFEVRR